VRSLPVGLGNFGEFLEHAFNPNTLDLSGRDIDTVLQGLGFCFLDRKQYLPN